MSRRIARVALALVVMGGVMAPATVAGSEPATGATASSDAATPGARATWDAAVAAVGDAPTRRTGAPAAAAAVVAPSVSVVPDTDLVRGQSVTVTASGLPAGSVAVLQCGDDSAFAYDCDLTGLTFLPVDANGAISTTKTVRRTIPSVGGYRDCAASAGTCELVVATSAAQLVARHPLAFDPNAPLPDSKITVEPDTGLLAGQTVTITGTGFAASAPVYVQECATVELSCSGVSEGTTTDATGAFSLPLTVTLRVRDANGDSTSCLVVDCVLRARSSNDPEFHADAPLQFDPTQPPPAIPHIDVTPSTGLHHDQQVTVTGSGFDPSMYVDIAQCGADATLYCGDYIGAADADEHGAFTTTVPVSRLATDYSDRGPDVVDCAEVPCGIRATGYVESEDFSLSARTPIAFDGSEPPPALPTVTVTPDHDLPYRSLVKVHGTGFAPGQYVYAQFCIGAPDAGTCTDYADGRSNADGTVDLDLNVRRRTFVGFTGSVLDCVDAGTACTVALQGSRGYERAEAPVTFDPNAPIPPPPSLTVTPDHDLGWRTTVDVAGANLTPGPTSIQQCGAVVFDGSTFSACTDSVPVVVAADGTFTSKYTVRRRIDNGFPAPVDCAVPTAGCSLRVGYGGPDDSASVPLSFDPNSQPPPPPALSYWPGGHLLDGRTTLLVGWGFTPGATIGLTECRAGATSIADSCDLGKAFTATADSAGFLATAWKPFGAGGNALGAFDCTTGPGACVLAAANASELEEFTTLPLTFDAPELMLESTTVDEGTDDMMPTGAHVMVGLSEPIGSPVTVAWHTTPGTAGEDDFTMRHGRVVIPAGGTEAMIHVEVAADAVDERTERFSVDVDTAPGAMIAAGSATVKIRDDDAGPAVSVADGGGREAGGGAWAAVHLSGPSGRTVVVKYVTHHQSARSGSDYVRIKGELVFAPGETTRYVGVPLVDDHRLEGTESFTVELYDADHAAIDRAVGTLTITDDD